MSEYERKIERTWENTDEGRVQERLDQAAAGAARPERIVIPEEIPALEALFEVPVKEERSDERTELMARELAEQGYAVLPLMPRSKAPRVKGGHNAATTDPEQAMRLVFGDSNVGVATGRRSEIVVLDIDPRNGGDKSFERLQEDIGPLPPTASVRTGGGGTHYYFRLPAGHSDVRTHKLAGYPGIDVKGEGGYVVAPPSTHPSGDRYQWIDLPGSPPVDELAEWPAAIDELEPAPEIDTAAAAIDDTATIPGGRRNDHLFARAREIRDTGIPLEGALRLTLAENDRVCDPPLGEDEVRETVRSAFKGDDGRHDDREVLRPVAANELVEREFPATRFLVDPYIPAAGITLVYGPAGVHKSMMVQQIAVEAACGGGSFLDRPLSATHITVAMVHGELDVGDIRKRMEAQLRGRPAPRNLFVVDRRTVAGICPLDTKDGQDALRRLVRGVRPGLLVLDSIPALAVGDVSETPVAKTVMHFLSGLVAEHRLAVIVVSHPRKESAQGDRADIRDRLKGAQELAALSESMVYLGEIGTDGIQNLDHGKSRHAAEAKRLAVRFNATTCGMELVPEELRPSRKKCPASAIVDYLKNHPGNRKLIEIAEARGVHRDTVKRELQNKEFSARYEQNGLVEVKRTKNAKGQTIDYVRYIGTAPEEAARPD